MPRTRCAGGSSPPRFIAAIGCHSVDKMPIPTVRGQVPEPIAPIPPSGPAAPVSPVGPSSPLATPASGGAVQGLPVPAGLTDPAVRTAGVAPLPTAVKAAALMKESEPQIKVVALIGGTNLITDQEVIEAVRQRLSEFRDLPGPARLAKERALYAEELRRIVERELILDDMYAKLKKQSRLGLVDEIKEFAEKAADQNLRRSARGPGSPPTRNSVRCSTPRGSPSRHPSPDGAPDHGR